jgi:hypothetical protein
MCGWEGFVWGFVGGVFGELLGWFKLRQNPTIPDYWKSAFYWFLTAAMFVSGGLLVVAYLRSHIAVQPILAINIGASAPLLIQSFVAHTPVIPPGRIN